MELLFREWIYSRCTMEKWRNPRGKWIPIVLHFWPSSKTIWKHSRKQYSSMRYYLPKPPLIMRFARSCDGWLNNTVPSPRTRTRSGIPYDIRHQRTFKITPNICKVSPSRPDIHTEDIDRWHCRHFERTSNRWRAPSIDLPTITGKRLRDNTSAPEADGDVIRIGEHASWAADSPFFGNIAPTDRFVKTAGVDDDMMTFSGTAKVFQSQEEAMENGILEKSRGWDVVVLQYEGPQRRTRMYKKCLHQLPIKEKALLADLVTDGRFSGEPVDSCIGHIALKQREGGPYIHHCSNRRHYWY